MQYAIGSEQCLAVFVPYAWTGWPLRVLPHRAFSLLWQPIMTTSKQPSHFQTTVYLSTMGESRLSWYITLCLQECSNNGVMRIWKGGGSWDLWLKSSLSYSFCGGRALQKIYIVFPQCFQGKQPEAAVHRMRRERCVFWWASVTQGSCFLHRFLWASELIPLSLSHRLFFFKKNWVEGKHFELDGWNGAASGCVIAQ